MTEKSARFKYIISIYLAGIVFFTLFRLVETIAYCATTEGPDDFGGLYWKALLMGLRFDTVVSCYVLALPLLMIIIGEFAHIRRRWYYGIAHYLLMTLYTICFFACAADIPYFCYFFNRLDVVALSWMEDFGTSVSMIVHEPMYILYFGVFVAFTIGWWLLGRLLFRRMLMTNIDERMSIAWAIPIALLLLGGGFLGMRGKLSKIPIRVSTAYFCSNPFLNQIGLNPVFTFLKSMEEAGKSSNQEVKLIDELIAKDVYLEWLDTPVDSTLSAIRLPDGMNVVLVLMESMSADKTALRDPATSLSPCLDSLMSRSMTFREAWSAGIHTHNGIYATLYGHPAILSRNLMRTSPTPQMCGLPHRLREAGYSTTYFMAHDEDFDGMRGFLYQNGFDRVVGQHTWPRNEIIGTWGIPDHKLFDHVIEHCDSAKGPFFACVMTCSDHGPYILPDDIDFSADRGDLQKAVAEYADWSIGRFVRMARGKSWFDNTLFVFIADHGASMNPTYDMPLAYNHVPLLFFAPSHIAARFDDRLAMQIDVAPTILAMLGLGDSGKMLGTDLTSHTRKYAYFSADDKIGVVDGEFFYLYRTKAESGSLYRYKEESTDDIIGEQAGRAEAMRNHAFGMIQSSQRILHDGSSSCDR